MRRALKLGEALLGAGAPATWDEAELLEVSLTTPRGAAGARALGVEPAADGRRARRRRRSADRGLTRAEPALGGRVHRRAVGPGPRGLELRGQRQQRALVLGLADELDAERQPGSSSCSSGTLIAGEPVRLRPA